MRDILLKAGCKNNVARIVAAHLVDSNLAGVESHGVMRVLQYVKQFQSGYMRIDGSAKIIEHDTFTEIDGGGGIGIPTMLKAVEHSASMVSEKGIYALPIRNVGHTGRLGAFTEIAAEAGCLMIVVGGGGRQKWRQVAPYGGRKAVLPTNPWSIAIPGGDRGPVVLDFATAMIAGGWLYAARSADALLPSGSIIDAQGKPSRNPEDYFNGGAILPKGGPMGYGLAVMAEMICEAMLGPVAVEANTLMITMDTHRYREPHIFQAAAEEILADLRASPAMEKNAVVEIPGERERDHRTRRKAAHIEIPDRTWRQINDLNNSLG